MLTEGRQGDPLPFLSMPDWRDISVWERLAAESAAVAAAGEVDPGDAAAITRLRRRFDADLVSAALELAQARRKATAKFACADTLWCDVAGVEQASSERVAGWKAQRMREVLGVGAGILDVCCGIGGDAMALSTAGLRVTAVDLDPRRAWMASRNAGCAGQVADAESLVLAGEVVHADPARRDERGGRRSWSLEDHQPGRAWIERALQETRAAAIKFSPGVDRRAFGAIPIAWEFIEDHGTLVQAVAWTGAFARQTAWTRATRIGASIDTIAGVPDDARADRIAIADGIVPGRFLCEPCAALERAQLLTEAAGGAARELARGLGLLLAESPLASAWFESFEIVEECPAREDAIRAVLVRQGLRTRSVRVRGRAVDADGLTKALSARPDGDAVVFAFRRGERTAAVVTRAAG